MCRRRLIDLDHMEERAKIDGAYLAIAVCGILINGFGAMFLGVSSLSHTLFFKSFCGSQLPHKSVNVSFAIAHMNNKLTDLCEI